MKKTVMIMISLVLMVIGIPLFSSGASEKAFPDPEKTITIVVPHAAGGGTDLIFRALAEEMKKVSGQNFIVTNVTGAGSATGTNEVINGSADGYTMLGAGTHTTAATMQGLTEGYKALDYITALNWDPFIIAVRKDKTWSSLKELETAARANPGKISFGNAGMGGATGVACVGINLAFDKAFNVTPFNGGADLIASVLGGHCDVGIFSQSEVKANSDALKPLAILGHEHSTIPELSRIPTLAEAGYPDLTVPRGSFRSLMVKKGTSEEAKQWLADIAEKAFKSEGFQKFMSDNGLIPEFHKLEDFKAYDATIIAEYEPILKEAGLYKL
jgi:putative tricarboxylic transport membrane protein